MDPHNPYASPAVDERLVLPQRPIVSFGDILRTGWTLYAANAPAIITVMLVVWVPLELFQAYMDAFVFGEGDDFRSLRLALLLDGLIGIIATGAVTAIGAASLRGEQPTWWDGLQAGMEAWSRLFWTRLVIAFFTTIGLLLLVVPGLIIMVRTLIADPVAVLERQSGLANVQRSFELTRGAGWLMLGLAIVLLGFMFGAGAVVGVVTLLVPLLDHWLVVASLSLIVDLAAVWPMLALLAAYWSLAHPYANFAEPPPPSAAAQQGIFDEPSG
jgi:hypothetical protein